MSTQHPDNVCQPFFAENSLLSGEDEVQEAYYAFSHLGCDEQMWDFEGKEVDNFVVKKLLTSNENFFKSKKLGQDVFLTFRVPNPEVEKGEAKILLETLESIPRSYDAAKIFYDEDIAAPIFEVILPMTMSARSLNRIYYYYKDLVTGKENKEIIPGDIKIHEWIGEFFPKRINVIPLFEDWERILQSADIVKEYLKDKQVEYQRVFLARSDPAVNYGSIAAVLLNKIALQRLWKLQEESGIKIYPILGAGSAPFRGNLRPETVEQLVSGYPSVRTFTVQSSFKFDNPPDIVIAAINKIKNKTDGAPLPVDEEKIIPIMEKYCAAYWQNVKKLAPVINQAARFVPRRRKRKLHIGLFEYARQNDDIKLPRAIAFTSALYSLGVPPEALGLESLSAADFSAIKEVYPNMEYDLRSALVYSDLTSPYFPADSVEAVKKYFGDISFNVEHQQYTRCCVSALQSGMGEDISSYILHAAGVRRFLG